MEYYVSEIEFQYPQSRNKRLCNILSDLASTKQQQYEHIGEEIHGEYPARLIYQPGGSEMIRKLREVSGQPTEKETEIFGGEHVVR